MPPAGRLDHHAAGVGQERVLEVDERHARQQLLGREHRVGRVRRETCAERRVHGGRPRLRALTEVEGEGLGERQVAESPRSQVAVAQHELRGSRDVEPCGQVTAVTLGEGRGSVDPGGTHRLEAGGTQQLVSTDDLGADLAGEPRRGQCGQVDRDIGLIDDLVGRVAVQLLQRGRTGMHVVAIDGVHGDGADRERGGDVAVFRQRARHGLGAGPRHRQHHGDAQRPVAAHRGGLLIRQERGEVPERGRRTLPEERDGHGIDVATAPGQWRAGEGKCRTARRTGSRPARRCARVCPREGR